MLGGERLRARQSVSKRSNRLHHDVVISSNKSSDGVGQRRVGAQEQRLAFGPVLRLGEQVGGARLGVGRLVGDDDHLARPGRQVDADPTRDEKLRCRDIGVSRADDAIDAGDRLGSVGEGGDCLGAADGVDLAEPQLAGDDQGGIDGVRRHDGDPPALLPRARARRPSRVTRAAGSVPLGTQTPTASSGSQRRSDRMPGAASTVVSAGRCASLKRRTA